MQKLGFGLMRLPKKGILTDITQVKEMVNQFMAAGGTYYDTAHVYPGSEQAVRKALVERYPRDSFTLATKLNAMMAPGERAAKKQFATSLERTGAGYFDYYLLHALMEGAYTKYDRWKLWDFVYGQKSKGLIKHLGFSFHAGPKLLDQLLNQHPDVDFVQLQINYLDWENPKVTARANYEVARKHNVPIVVMEPVKGGALENPPAEVKKLFSECRPGMSPASWAIRFAASLDGVMTVLSGMSNLAQMEDNLSYMRDFRPLDDTEQKIIQQAQRIMGKSAAIPCTGCRYCVEGCPRNIPIPEIFAAMNKRLANGQAADAESAYWQAVGGGSKASDCIGCGQCEKVCPQRLEVVKHLRGCAEVLEK